MKLPVIGITLRIYIVGLVQAALSITAFVIVVRYAFYRHPELDDVVLLEHVVAETARGLGDPVDPGRRARDVAAELHTGIRAVRADGHDLVAIDAGRLVACGPVAAGAKVQTEDASCIARRVVLPDGEPVTITVMRARPGLTLLQIIAVFIAVFAVGSLLLGRSFAGPLRRMAAAARAFGRGDTRARVALHRRDEVGAVARAFDEMADQIVDLRRAERELLANISHELRTPLTRIRLALEIGGGATSEIASQSRQDIAEDLDELERLISDVLTAARMELDGAEQPKGLSPLRIEVVNVHDLVVRSIARFRGNHPGRPIRVTDEAAGCVVEADPVQFRRALDNLLENAHKYSPDTESEVELHVFASEESFHFHVIDHGVGIAEEDQENVFRPFFRAERSRARTSGGLGLGLLLVRRIAEAHGGTAAILSEPGKGTEAILSLPRTS